MKLIPKLALTSAVIALAFMSTANAQNMRVNVPFAFHAGRVVLPAGTYQVETSQTSPIIRLSQLDGKFACLVMTKAYSGSAQPNRRSVAFNRHGTTYFLSRVTAGSVKGSAEVYTSPAEREYSKARPEAKETVYVASER
jgi:hypothetical protein